MINLSMYKPVELEEKINAIYQANGIFYISDLTVENISIIFNLAIAEYPGPSFASWDDPYNRVVFLNSKISEAKRRAVFFHELSHVELHEGNQKDMPQAFKELQESQAKIFQLYAAMPIYLFEDLYNISYFNSVSVLAEKFILPPELVKERLQQIFRRINNAQRDYWLKEQVSKKYRKADPANWSKETRSLLDQLYAQIARKRVMM